MHKEWADKWVAALRSGEYAQSRKALYVPEPKNSSCGIEECCKPVPAGYCCLGVLTHIVSKEHPEAGAFEEESGAFIAPDGRSYSSYPPMEIMVKIVGADTVNPILFTEEGVYEDEDVSCSGANDGKGMTFAQIADLIEQNYESM